MDIELLSISDMTPEVSFFISFILNCGIILMVLLVAGRDGPCVPANADEAGDVQRRLGKPQE